MKRYGDLFHRIVSFDNLCIAARKALRGKKEKGGVARFYFHLETELFTLQDELRSGRYRMQPYRTFEVLEPKRRRICAAGFRDRVVHHAICNLLDPVFERCMIADTYVCRRKKGSHAAVRRAQGFTRRFPFFLKCDIRKYFDSIDHDVLKALLGRKIKDRDLLCLLDRIIDHPIPGGVPGKGVPIGNLTSQYFANLYLGELDHFVKERLHCKGYVRYMDDFLLFATEKGNLHEFLAAVRGFLDARLHLKLKESALLLAPVTKGVPFLGFRVFPSIMRLDRVKWTRYCRKVRKREKSWEDGKIDEQALARFLPT